MSGQCCFIEQKRCTSQYLFCCVIENLKHYTVTTYEQRCVWWMCLLSTVIVKVLLLCAAVSKPKHTPVAWFSLTLLIGCTPSTGLGWSGNVLRLHFTKRSLYLVGTLFGSEGMHHPSSPSAPPGLPSLTHKQCWTRLTCLRVSPLQCPPTPIEKAVCSPHIRLSFPTNFLPAVAYGALYQLTLTFNLDPPFSPFFIL